MLAVPADIQADAQQLLLRQPDAKAVVLFGSRARNQAHKNSDWDIALITRSGDQVSFLRDQEHGFSRSDVECIVIPEPIIEDDCRTLGRLSRSLLRDGVTLAGQWDKTLPTKGIIMDVRDYMASLHYALKALQEGAITYGELGNDLFVEGADDWTCNAFTQRSADAAERCGKALIIGLGLEPVKRHDMSALAKQARKAGFLEQAGWLDALNGNTQVDHVADYSGKATMDEARCRRAVSRFQGALELYGHLMNHWPDEVANHLRVKAMLSSANLLDEMNKAFEKARLADEYNPDHPPLHIKALLEKQDLLIQTVKNVCASIESHVREHKTSSQGIER